MIVEAGAPVLRALERLVAAAYPDEGCGVLLGTGVPGRTALVEVTSGRNLRTDRARDRYELDPGDIVRAERFARTAGLDVVGFWHSHPDHPARPSAFDTERAWPEYVYVIAGTTGTTVAEVRAWTLKGEGLPFAECPITSPEDA